MELILRILQSPEFGQFVTNTLIMVALAVIPLVGNAVRGFFNANKDNATVQTVLDIARMAVLAAEQLGITGAIDDKKSYAITVAERMLAERGIKVDLDALDAAIEAAVAEELNAVNALPPAPAAPAPVTTEGGA